MISFAAGRVGIVFLGGANLLLFGQKSYMRLLGAVSVLCKWSVVPEPGDVWVPCK